MFGSLPLWPSLSLWGGLRQVLAVEQEKLEKSFACFTTPSAEVLSTVIAPTQLQALI